jgi:hypothetical protein
VALRRWVKSDPDILKETLTVVFEDSRSYFMDLEPFKTKGDIFHINVG